VKHPRLYRLIPGAVVLGFFLCLLAGRYPSPGLLSPGRLAADPTARLLLLNLRLPRLIAALLLGASLGAGGTVFQMLFANPLVEPGFLGVSQGASFGASLAILFLPPLGMVVQLSAGLFALGGLFLSWFIARRLHFGGWIIRLHHTGQAGQKAQEGVDECFGQEHIESDPLGRSPIPSQRIDPAPQ
jgi:iron complex transport system permease protein